jgi:tetratricopeptide (TPR) repeat protein
MKPSTELFDLIKSLTKSEKRFFKLSSSLQTGDKNYLKIFDAVDRQAEYDEAAIKEQFNDEVFIKHFPSEKNHLYKLILKSLRAYHADNSVSSILKQEIKNIEILYNKALFKECNKFLMRAKKLAIEHEKFYYLFELISWEKMLLEEALEDGQFTKDLDLLIKEEQEVIEKLRNLAAYHVLYSKINYVFRSGGFVRSEEDKCIVDEIKNHPLIKGKNTALSKRAATICYYTQGFCNLAEGDYTVALEKFLRVKQIVDDNAHLRQDIAKRYVRTLNYITVCLIDGQRFEEAKVSIAELRSLAEQREFGSTDIALHIFKSANIAELQVCQLTEDYERGHEVVAEIVTGMAENEGKLHKEQVLSFSYQIASFYFACAEYSKALHWLNKVLNDNENTLRQDVYSYARLFNLVVHFELGNYDLLEYITKSTQRYLSKRQRDYSVERLVIEYVRKLIRTTNDADRRGLFEQFEEEMMNLTNAPAERVVLKYFDFVHWARSHQNKYSVNLSARRTG